MKSEIQLDPKWIEAKRVEAWAGIVARNSPPKHAVRAESWWKMRAARFPGEFARWLAHVRRQLSTPHPSVYSFYGYLLRVEYERKSSEAHGELGRLADKLGLHALGAEVEKLAASDLGAAVAYVYGENVIGFLGVSAALAASGPGGMRRAGYGLEVGGAIAGTVVPPLGAAVSAIGAGLVAQSAKDSQRYQRELERGLAEDAASRRTEVPAWLLVAAALLIVALFT